MLRDALEKSSVHLAYQPNHATLAPDTNSGRKQGLNGDGSPPTNVMTLAHAKLT
jgi:hypothetical protein